MKNKKGFSLIELILALIVSCIGFVAAIEFFYIDINSIQQRFNLMASDNYENNFIMIRNIIKQGHVNKEESKIKNTVVQPTQLSIITTYFSKDYMKPELYTITCSSDYGGVLYGQKHGEKAYKLISNVKNCKFEYYDIKGNKTTEQTKMTKVVLNLSYINPSSKNGDVITKIIIQKMMQES